MTVRDERSPGSEGTEADPSQGFFSRWSQRKHEARAAAEAAPAEPPVPVDARHSPPETPDKTSPQLTDADMPPLESLDEHADYRGFLSPKVSEELRRSALRKLFSLPKFNVCDGLDDYAEDFTSFQPLGDLVTHEMRRLLEREKERLTKRPGEAEPAEGADPQPRLVEASQLEDPPLAEPGEDPVVGAERKPADVDKTADS